MRVSKRCCAVTGLGYSTPWCVNAGFIVGDDETLIVDTGGNTLAAQTIYGYATAMAPTNRLHVINTEAHFDHIGGNSFFRSLGIEVHGHPGIARTPAEFAAEIEEFNAAIPDPRRRAKHEADCFFHETTLANPDRPIDEGPFGSGLAEIVFTPGHTATNLSVWVSEDRVLYTGDCLINRYSPNLDAGGPKHWKIWLESLGRIEALDPAVVVAGHGPVAQGAEVRRIMNEVRRTLTEALRTGDDL